MKYPFDNPHVFSNLDTAIFSCVQYSLTRSFILVLAIAYDIYYLYKKKRFNYLEDTLILFYICNTKQQSIMKRGIRIRLRLRPRLRMIRMRISCWLAIPHEQSVATIDIPVYYRLAFPICSLKCQPDSCGYTKELRMRLRRRGCAMSLQLTQLFEKPECNGCLCRRAVEQMRAQESLTTLQVEPTRCGNASRQERLVRPPVSGS